VRIPIPNGRISQVFLKERIRRSADFALSSVAMVAEISDGICEDIRIVLGGVAPFPYVASAAEEMAMGKTMEEGSISRTADAAVEDARPLRMNHYKVDLTRALVRRALGSMWKP
jgi:xanthine dehydrogenase YagS FAD-binding subunit